MSADWSVIEALPKTPIVDLFGGDDDRLKLLAHETCGMRFDFAKTHLTRDAIAAFEKLAKSIDFAAKREALFTGAIVNPSEGRAAEHTAQRGEGAPSSVALAKALHDRMRALIDAIAADALGPVRHIVHIGIGGSALGPDLVVDALPGEQLRYDIAIVSNIDGYALQNAVSDFDPAATLIVIASKTFTTTETMLNASSALAWLEEGGVVDPFSRVIALTAAPDAAVEWGVDETRVLPFPQSVGGRYSLWSSIGFPAALALGWDAFEELLEGAAEMDRHFRLTAPSQNVPMLAAFADLLYTQTRGITTRAVFAYDERLRLLPSYLQQLEMESNGKSVTADGAPLGRPSAAITWGGVGTDGQHAVFQLLHQGSHVVPVEFVACVESGDSLDPEHHRLLLVNAFAQGAALMAGRASKDGNRSYPGDRPSTTILLDRLDARTLGALIAFYEQRTFANAVMLGINPFDQFGVELGKAMATSVDDPAERAQFDASTRALIERAGV